MKRGFRYAVGVALLFWAGQLLVARVTAEKVEPAEGVESELRAWTAHDSARVRYFSTGSGGLLWGAGTNVATPSPDGRSFFFISHHGDLDCDCNVSELSVFRVSDVVRALESNARAVSIPPAPWRTATMGHKYAAIAAARWEGEDAIVFLGRRDPGNSGQVYRLDLITGDLRALTDTPHQEGLYGLNVFATRGDGVIAFSQEAELRTKQYPYYAWAPRRAREMLGYVPKERPVNRAYVSFDGRPSWQIRAINAGTEGPWFSDDGRRAIVAHVPEPVPAGWGAYDGTKVLHPEDPEAIGPATFFQFALVDLEQQVMRPLFDAPMGDAIRAGAGLPMQALWSHDGGQVVLVNTALPVGSSVDAPSMAYLISYDLQKGSWDVLEPVRQSSGVTVKDVSWRTPGREFLVRHVLQGQAVAGTVYSLREGHWTPRIVSGAMESPARKPPALAQELKVELRQSANDPPMVVASRRGREVGLVAPDPTLEGIWMARTQLFTWRDSEGVARTSTLLLPRKLPTLGEKVPLVIQATLLYPADLKLADFHPDGIFSTAYADQALAAQGMVVLNLDTTIKIPGLGGTYQETEVFADWVASVTAALAKVYPVDPERVGLVGFSRFGYLTRYLITHPGRLRPAAAVIADSYTGSYLLEMLQYATGSEQAFATSYHSIYGGSFFESKSAWMDREVSFNVDKVQTPVLFADNGYDLASVVDTVGAFTANHKPFEYLFLGDNGHELLLPRVREASLEATVDWMRFWLQGQEDPRPEKSERYTRWRAQRELQEAHGTFLRSVSPR